MFMNNEKTLEIRNKNKFQENKGNGRKDGQFKKMKVSCEDCSVFEARDTEKMRNFL